MVAAVPMPYGVVAVTDWSAQVQPGYMSGGGVNTWWVSFRGVRSPAWVPDSGTRWARGRQAGQGHEGLAAPTGVHAVRAGHGSSGQLLILRTEERRVGDE